MNNAPSPDSSPSPLRSLPNLISVARLFLAVPVAFAIVGEDWAAALLLYLVAGLSDGLDGFLARRFHWESALGKMLDPVADKLLLLVVTVSLVYVDLLPIAFAALLLSKDIVVVGGFGLYVLLAGLPRIEPLRFGKLTTAAQITLIVALLGVSLWKLPVDLEPMIWFVAAVTLVDGILYHWIWTDRLRRDRRYRGGTS